MTFSSLTFFVFFSIVLILISLFNFKILRNNLKEEKIKIIKHYILLVASYVFYAWWDYRFCFLMLIMTFIAYYCARQIDEENNVRMNKFLGVFVPLLFLGIFKYFNFFIESFCFMFGIENVESLNIILPVGISFYTFQSLSYTIDVARRDIKSQNFKNVALYVAFFPQLVAGPIIKASDFIPQLDENKNVTLKNLSIGLQIFLFGLIKKIVIADHLSVFVDDVFSKPGIFSWYTIILAIVSYSIQIYFDFSGYSDMAVGTAKCLGYDFQKNFDVPYISKNVSEFWKRWHISLSTWLQQYLYIPLGGNRKGVKKTYINLILTMVLGGLWHGASVNFIIWGLFHGIALCIHKVYKKHSGNYKTSLLKNVISIVGTYIFVCVCWIFFRASDISTAKVILNQIFTFSDGVVQIYSWSIVGIILLVLAELMAYINSRKNDKERVEGYYLIMNLTKMKSLVILFTIIGLVFALAYTDANPFIYFQF